MNVPVMLSVATASVGVLIGLLALGLSRAPGWRELRAFAASSALAGLYSACDVAEAIGASDAATTLSSQLSLALGGLHAVSWMTYFAAQENRGLRGWEKAVALTGLAFGVLALVPGGLYSGVVQHHDFAPLGVTYADPVPTALGAVSYAFFSGGLGLLAVRYGLRWRAGLPGAAAHCVGLTVFCLTGVNDGLASAGLLGTPYLLDLGFLVVLCSVGGAVTSRFVASAAALRDSSQRLEEAQAELVKKERLAALGELSAMVAHEVRNPLGVFFNSLASFKRTTPSSPQTDLLLNIMSEEADRLNRLVNNLLEVARPDGLRRAPAELERVLESAIAVARTATAAPEADVALDIFHPLPMVCVDEQMLRQALINLIANAIQAPRRTRGVTVRVEPEPDSDFIRFEVIDDGDGVPADLAERIFTPFFTTRAAGTGLGLAVVRRVAEAHQGSVTVRPTPGGGATFVLRLRAVA